MKSVTNKLNQIAGALKATKDIMAVKAVKWVGDVLVPATAVYLHSAQLTVYGTTAVLEGLRVISRDGQLQDATAEMVSHIIQDAANRLNELSSILDRVTDQPKVAQAIKAFQDTMASVDWTQVDKLDGSTERKFQKRHTRATESN